MSYTLGINFFHSDASACLFYENNLISAVEEERFSRIKHDSNFPINAIKFCLNYSKISFSDVETITVNTNKNKNLLKKFLYLLNNPYSYKIFIKKSKSFFFKKKIQSILKSLNLANEFKGKIVYIDHHLAHLESSSFYENFNDALHVSLDGFGDFSSGCYAIVKNKKIIIKKKNYFPHSLGIFYQSITQFLGFKNYGDEYKVMGMASYGNPRFINCMNNIVQSNDFFSYKLNLDYFNHHIVNIEEQDNKTCQIKYKDLYSKKLTLLLGKERNQDDEITEKHFDIACSAQKHYENIFFKLLNDIQKKYKIKNLALSGGCAMNSAANGKILFNTNFEDVYVSPNPGDSGGSLGSAISYLKRKKNYNKFNNNSAYLGTAYSSKEIESIIIEKKLKNSFDVKKMSFEDINEIVCSSIADGKVIGWFQDKMEWGPRALGNRSILGDPRNQNMKNILNNKIKRRENFRPFAPSILSEYMQDWFEIIKQVPYMSEVYNIKYEQRLKIPAVTHIDGSGRLQTVTKKDNIKFYNLIYTFYQKFGVPILLNTSFNENEPIVESPEQAIECFLRTKMDIIVLEDWIITRSPSEDN